MLIHEASTKAVAEATKIIAEMKAGKREIGIEWADDVVANKVTVQEMIGTADGGQAFLEKVTYDLYQGREEKPLLYKSIYQQIVDANLPKYVKANEMGPVQVVFLQHLEGAEANFGTLKPGTQKIVEIITYSSAIEYSEDMVEFNNTWEISEISRAFGDAYNMLLNHLHLAPIITATYVTTGGGLSAQKKAQKAGTAQLIAFDTSVAKTLRNGISVLPNGTIALVNSADVFALEDAIKGAMYADLSPSVVKRTINPANFIVYDGEEIEVGGETYIYPGVTAGTCYLISPNKKNFKEYIKHDLRVDSDVADLSRLIISEAVGRARRGVMAGIGGKDGAVKVMLA